MRQRRYPHPRPHHRRAVYADAWGTSPPKAFVPFMRWLDEQLRSGRLAWCCDPVLTHFLPATRFTHWPTGLRAVTHVLSLPCAPETQC